MNIILWWAKCGYSVDQNKYLKVWSCGHKNTQPNHKKHQCVICMRKWSQDFLPFKSIILQTS